MSDLTFFVVNIRGVQSESAGDNNDLRQFYCLCICICLCCEYLWSAYMLESAAGDNNDLTQFYCPQWLVTTPNARSSLGHGEGHLPRVGRYLSLVSI